MAAKNSVDIGLTRLFRCAAYQTARSPLLSTASWGVGGLSVAFAEIEAANATAQLGSIVDRNQEPGLDSCMLCPKW